MINQNFVNIGYLASWEEYSADRINAQNLTHIMFAFADLSTDGNVSVSSPNAIGNNPGNWLQGHLGKLWQLKSQNRNVKVCLSIGGACEACDLKFGGIAADPSKRRNFVRSAIQLVNDLGLDGLDIDWEFPKTRDDSQNFVTLLAELRTALNNYARSKNDQAPYLLTAAVPVGAQDYEKLQLGQMNQYLDFFNLMGYDFAGSWSATSDHNAPIFSRFPGGACCDNAITYYIRAGVDPSKIVLGMPMYGRIFNIIDFDNSGDGFGKKFNISQVEILYKELPKAGAKEKIDKFALASWSWDPEKREFISYDTPNSVKLKCDYIKKHGLAGAMFWKLDGDNQTKSSRSLIVTACQQFGGPDSLEKSLNHINFPRSKWENVKKVSVSNSVIGFTWDKFGDSKRTILDGNVIQVLARL